MAPNCCARRPVHAAEFSGHRNGTAERHCAVDDLIGEGCPLGRRGAVYRAEFASEKRRGLTVTFMIIFTIGYYVVFTFLPTYFIETLHLTKTNAFVSSTLASLVALILILPMAALSDRVGRRPTLIAAAVVSLLTILTLSETAGRPLPQGVWDEMFQFGADVRGGASTG